MHCYTLIAIHQVRAKPLQETASKSELVQLLQQAAMVHLVEGPRHIHIDHLLTSPVFRRVVGSPVVRNFQKFGGA